MIKAILNSWVVLLPVTIYLFWLFFNTQKKDVKVRDEYLARKRRYSFYAIYSTGFIILALLVFYFFNAEPTPERIQKPFW